MAIRSFWQVDGNHTDLTRGAGGGKTVQTTTGTFTFLPEKSCLVIVDMQGMRLISSKMAHNNLNPPQFSSWILYFSLMQPEVVLQSRLLSRQ
jgi:hypothetical protein